MVRQISVFRFIRKIALSFPYPKNVSTCYFFYSQLEQVDVNDRHCGSCLGILEQDQILGVVDKVL